MSACPTTEPSHAKALSHARFAESVTDHGGLADLGAELEERCLNLSSALARIDPSDSRAALWITMTEVQPAMGRLDGLVDLIDTKRNEVRNIVQLTAQDLMKDNGISPPPEEEGPEVIDARPKPSTREVEKGPDEPYQFKLAPRYEHLLGADIGQIAAAIRADIDPTKLSLSGFWLVSIAIESSLEMISKGQEAAAVAHRPEPVPTPDPHDVASAETTLRMLLPLSSKGRDMADCACALARGGDIAEARRHVRIALDAMRDVRYALLRFDDALAGKDLPKPAPAPEADDDADDEGESKQGPVGRLSLAAEALKDLADEVEVEINKAIALKYRACSEIAPAVQLWDRLNAQVAVVREELHAVSSAIYCGPESPEAASVDPNVQNLASLIRLTCELREDGVPLKVMHDAIECLETSDSGGPFFRRMARNHLEASAPPTTAYMVGLVNAGEVVAIGRTLDEARKAASAWAYRIETEAANDGDCSTYDVADRVETLIDGCEEFTIWVEFEQHGDRPLVERVAEVVDIPLDACQRERVFGKAGGAE